jgi:radical SAM-linked protein
VAFSEGFHPHPKLSFGEALPLGMESEAEEAWMVLTEAIDANQVRERLNTGLPHGLAVTEVARVLRREPPPAAVRVTYRVEPLSPLLVHHALQNWRSMLDDRFVKKTKRHSQQVTLGQVLLDLRQVDADALEMDLLEGGAVRLRPLAIVKHIAGGGEKALAASRICRLAVRPVEENENVRRTDHQCQTL